MEPQNADLCLDDYWEQSFYRDLDDPEYRPIQKARLSWKFKGVHGTRDQPNRAKIMRSPPAYVGGYWWTIKFFPRGNNVSSLSIYIECSRKRPSSERALRQGEFIAVQGPSNASLTDCAPDIDLKFSETDNSATWLDNYYEARQFAPTQGTPPSGPWRVSAQIGVALYNPQEPRTGWTQSSCHQFNPQNADWGWTNFHGPWDSVHRRQHGQRRALLQNDTLAFDAYIRIVDDPTHSLWWHPSDFEPMWDSLGLTGYRPLGASTIGRSAEVAGLASWLNIAPFCKIIQNVDILEHLTNCDAKPKPLCDALQKFLWEWRGCEEPMDYISIDGISTTLQNLLESSSDVCEFWERLRRTIELELAGTEAVKELAELFDSPPADELRHLSGPVHTLPNAFNSRICVRAEQVKSTREALEGYLSAKPGRWLLPPILHLELSRQKLDVLAQQWRLVYDRVDLDEEVDLTPWVPQGQCASYVLYGYIVHRGPRASGKFFSVLRPAGPGTKWLAFDDGSDNRLDCLTRKTALQSYVGVSPSQTVDHKVGHDVAVAVMYVRSDVVREILPGPQDRWDATEFMRKYYEHGTHLILKAPDEASAKQLVQVEVYALPKYDGLGSLFDTYDLMSHAKATDNVMYLKFPRSASMSEVRKSIASCMSADGNQIHPEHVRLWEIGHARELFGAILSFRRIADLNATLHQPMDTIRFWMQVVSDGKFCFIAMAARATDFLIADAEHFAMSDPQELNAPEDKREDTTADDGSESSDSQSSTEDEDDSNHASTPPVEPNVTRTSSAGNASYTLETAQPPAVTREPDPSAGDVLPEVSNNDAATAVMVADDVERMDAEEEQRWDEPVEGEQNESDADEAMELAHTGASKTQLPVRHAYYFIQLFDIEGQCLRTVGSYFSRLEESAKSVLRRHLNWPEDKDFLVWIRVDGSTAAPVRPGEALENFFVMDGTCFIVQEKLSKQQ